MMIMMMIILLTNKSKKKMFARDEIKSELIYLLGKKITIYKLAC